jgi:NADH-quinone oxidoreductase subunit A
MESQNFFGLVFFALLVAGNFAGMILIAHLLGKVSSRAGDPAKLEPFECGYPPEAPLPPRASVTFYMAGLLLLVFDVEIVFLYPWAAEFRSLGVTGFVEMLVFIGMLLAGYVYVRGRGAFRW